MSSHLWRRETITRADTRIPYPKSYFDRDVDCVRRFFRKRFRYESDEYPRFKDLFPDRVPGVEKDNAASETGGPGSDAPRLDILAKASGYGGGSKQDKELETVSDHPFLRHPISNFLLTLLCAS